MMTDGAATLDSVRAEPKMTPDARDAAFEAMTSVRDALWAVQDLKLLQRLACTKTGDMLLPLKTTNCGTEKTDEDRCLFTRTGVGLSSLYSIIPAVRYSASYRFDRLGGPTNFIPSDRKHTVSGLIQKWKPMKPVCC